MKDKIIMVIICIITGVALGVGTFFVTNTNMEPVNTINSSVTDFYKDDLSVDLMENATEIISDMVSSGSSVILNSLSAYKAGDQIDISALDTNALDNYFTSSEISQDIMNRILGKSYPANCPVSTDDLRYIKLLHYGFDNKVYVGELIVNKQIASDITEIFKTLFQGEYPIEKMLLIDEYNADDEASMNDNNSSAFNYRFISGTSTISNHSFGMAIDINPLYNPYVVNRGGVQIISPVDGKAYANRNDSFNYKIDKNDLCYKTFTAHGFTWGGDWNGVKDYQHFEKDFK